MMSISKSYEATKVGDYKLLSLSSESFPENGMIPTRHTCDGENVNPSIHIDGIPEEALSLALIVDDPDAPGGTFCHWIIWNIPQTHQIREKETRGVQGTNDFGKFGYGGPCPPRGPHHYRFKVYALDCTLGLSSGAGKKQLEKEICDHVLAFGVLTGLYKRPE